MVIPNAEGAANRGGFVPRAFGEASAAIPMAPYSIPSKSPKTFRHSNAPTSHKPQAAENEAPVTLSTEASTQRSERGTAAAEEVKEEEPMEGLPLWTLPVRLAIDMQMQPPGVPQQQQQQQFIRGSVFTADAAQVELLPADGHPDVKQETPPGPSVPAGPSTSSRKNRKCDFLPTDSDYEEMQSNQGVSRHPLQGRGTAEDEVESSRRNRRAILFGSDSEEEEMQSEEEEMQSDDEESQSEDDEEMHSEEDEEMQSEDEESQSDDDEMQSGEDEEMQSNQGGNRHPPEGQDAAEEEEEEDCEEGQAKNVTIQSRILEAFNKRDCDTWMSRPEVWEEVTALVGTASGSSIARATTDSLLYRGHKENTFLKRRIAHPGSTKKVTEFALWSKMTCEGCKKPQDDAQEMMLCGCCMSVWHLSCCNSNGTEALSSDLWFCSDRCAEEMAQNEKPRAKGQKMKRKHAEEEEKEEEEEEEPQRPAKKRRRAVPSDGATHPSAASPSARRRKSTDAVMPEVQHEELLDAIIEAMRQGGKREFLSATAIFKRVQSLLGPQASAPYRYYMVYDRLNAAKLQHLFLSRVGESGRKEYMVLQDLPCQKCGKQDDQENFLICSSGKCSEGWHMKCLPGKHRLEAIPPPEADWFCPGCPNGHQDCGNKALKKEASKRVKKAAAGPTRKGGASKRGKGSSKGHHAKDTGSNKPQQPGAPPPTTPANTAGAAAKSSAAAATPPQDPLLPGTSTPPGDSSDPVITAQNQQRRQKVLYLLKTPGLSTKLYLEFVNRLEFYEAIDMMQEAAKLADGVVELLEQRITGDPL